MRESQRMTERETGGWRETKRRSEVQREINRGRSCHLELPIKTHFSVTGEPKLSSPLQIVSHGLVFNSL